MTDDAAALPWRHRISLRLRITVVTALVVTVVITAGGVLILLLLRSELIALADDEGRERSAEIAQQADALPAALPEMRDPETFVQVVADGRVVAATEGIDQGTVFDLPAAEPGEVYVEEVPDLPVDGSGPFRVVARGVAGPNGPMTVFAAISVQHLEDTIKVAAETGVIGLSILVVVLSTVMWFALGRALSPVEAIRARADAITGQNLDSRVPEPPHHDEIGRLARTVNQMLERLQRSAERLKGSAEQQRRFVADAAHELRSPLASLRVQLETARDGAGLSGREGDLLEDAGRMEKLVDQLLVLARADSDAPWLRPTAVDLDDVVDSAVAASAGARGCSGPVTVDTHAVEPVQLNGDPQLLEQMVRNLVDNALRHARGQVRITVSAVPGEVATLTVEDDGSGVPVDRREEIFGRFVRLDDSRDRDLGGVGLGLSIVAEVVRAHGGRIEVGDSPMGGACFLVELPVDGAGSAPG